MAFQNDSLSNIFHLKFLNFVLYGPLRFSSFLYYKLHNIEYIYIVDVMALNL